MGNLLAHYGVRVADRAQPDHGPSETIVAHSRLGRLRQGAAAVGGAAVLGGAPELAQAQAPAVATSNREEARPLL